MTYDLEEIARHIADVIIKDLRGRQGFDGVFDSISPEVYSGELYPELVDKIIHVLEGWQIQ